MFKTSIRLLYWRQDIDPAHGKAAGSPMSLDFARGLGTKEARPEIGCTRIKPDRDLITRLLEGKISIDVTKTTEAEAVFAERPILLRQVATEVVTLGQTAWERSGYCQPVGDARIYSEYVSVFLAEFTACIARIPLTEHPRLFPPTLVFPCDVDVLVARDGIAFVYHAARRPETVSVTIDRSQVLDALLLPHPSGKSYSCSGPSVVRTGICDDTHYFHLKGQGTTDTTYWGNPRSVILERRWHGFIEDLNLCRMYPDGESVTRSFQFVEMFGATASESFSEQHARNRARAYARLWAAGAITHGRLNSTKKIRTAVEEFRELVRTKGTDESALEALLDTHPWMLERALSCATYHSQVRVPAAALSRSDSDIQPDKLLERHDGYVDVLDMKRADVVLVVGGKNRKRPSFAVTEAEAQIDAYTRFLEEPAVREYLATIGIRVLRPRGVLLIGRRPNLTDDWEDVRQRLSVFVHTYDDILDELDILLDWLADITTGDDSAGTEETCLNEQNNSAE